MALVEIVSQAKSWTYVTAYSYLLRYSLKSHFWLSLIAGEERNGMDVRKGLGKAYSQKLRLLNNLAKPRSINGN